MMPKSLKDLVSGSRPVPVPADDRKYPGLCHEMPFIGDLTPLQTHGLVDVSVVWHPPKSQTKLYSYDERDEVWMRSLIHNGDGDRFGSVETITRPKPLYDVRNDLDEFVGFTDQNPLLYWNRQFMGRLRLVTVMNRGDKFPGRGQDDRQSAYREIIVQVERYALKQRQFLVWFCKVADAPDLVRTNWIKVLGDDKKQQYFRDLQRRAWEFSDRRYLRSVGIK